MQELNAFQRAVRESVKSEKALKADGFREKLNRRFRASGARFDNAYIHDNPLDLLDVVKGKLPAAVIKNGMNGSVCILKIKDRKGPWLATTLGCAAKTASVTAMIEDTSWSLWALDDTEEEQLCQILS